MIQTFLIHLLILIAIYAIVALSLNLVLGYSGLLSLGHIALFGIGAYTSALLSLQGFPFITAFILGGIVTAIAGTLLILGTKHLKGEYFALATLGFSFVIYSLLNNLEFTGGPLGLPGIPKPSLLGITLHSQFSYLIFALIILVITTLFIYFVVSSPFGRLLGAMRDDELGLRVLGKNTTLLKYKVMIISGFFTGLAGSLFAHYTSFIDPSAFSLLEIVFLLTIVLVGGLATLQGTIIAAFVVVLVPEILRFLSIPGTVLGPLRQIIYASILIIILLFWSKGLYGKVDLI